MKDRKLRPFEMNDQELEVFVRTVLNGRKFNFDARTGEERVKNAAIMESFHEYLDDDSMFYSFMVQSYKGDLRVQVLGIRQRDKNPADSAFIKFNLSGWGTVEIIKTLIKSTRLLKTIELVNLR